MEEVKSAGSAVLTSPGLAAFKQTLADAQTQFDAIERELATVGPRADLDLKRFSSWERGWLMRRLMKTRFAKLRAKSEESQATDRT